jgi:hypothetical protein
LEGWRKPVILDDFSNSSPAVLDRGPSKTSASTTTGTASMIRSRAERLPCRGLASPRRRALLADEHHAVDVNRLDPGVARRGHAHIVIESAGGRAAIEAGGMRWLNTVPSNVKRSLDGTYHAFKFPTYAHRYLAEAAWRFVHPFFGTTAGLT